MNDTRLLPDDPKLTAYALGELTGDERATVEAAMRENPALRVTVDEIRATAARLEAALAGEAVFNPATTTTNKASNTGIVIELNGRSADAAAAKAATANFSPRSSGRQTAAPRGGDYPAAPSRPVLLRFPQFYYVCATAAAACFAVVVALQEKPMPPAAKPVARTVVREIALAPADAPKPEDTLAETPTVALPLDGRIAGPVPSSAADSVAVQPVNSVETAPASVVVLSPPAFIEGSLSLIGQTRHDQDAERETAKASVEVGVKPFFPRNRETTPRPTFAGIGADPRTPAPEFSRRVATPLFTDAFTPSVTAPVVASPAVPSLVPHTLTASTLSSRLAATPVSGEVVVLDAFMVTAERATGFATSYASTQRAASDKRVTARRDDLPSPPPGAKFGKNTEAYSYIRDNDFLSALDNPLSTFSIDVDTASYANVRRIIEHGSPPPRDAVRIEELVNYFPYRYPAPKGDVPFAASLEVADAPWAPKHRLVRIGLKAREVTTAQRPAASLVFLLDVSGSMNQPNKLPLVKQSMRLLLGKLRADDRVAIVTYAGNSGLALASTPVAQAREIKNALDALTPGGSTNGAMGIQLAYEIARANFVQNGINRVILCTDGDFNVGTTSEGELVRLIEEKATSGVFLTVLGFGMGNYKDATLEKLADKGNGNYGYIDTSREAEKLLVEQVNSTLVTVAKDVKIQVEFNPATVSSYRLIGYENRLLRKEDFNDDKIDAGEIGAGHTITALYEIVPVGAESRSGGDVPPLDELKYSARGAVSSRLEMPSNRRDPLNNELLTVKIRYKKPDSLFSFPKPLEFPLVNAKTAFAKASADFRFAAAVAQFGMILRGSPHRGTATMGDVGAWAATAVASAADDPGGYRAEFLDLVRKTQTMME